MWKLLSFNRRVFYAVEKYPCYLYIAIDFCNTVPLPDLKYEKVFHIRYFDGGYFTDSYKTMSISIKDFKKVNETH